MRKPPLFAMLAVLGACSSAIDPVEDKMEADENQDGWLDGIVDSDAVDAEAKSDVKASISVEPTLVDFGPRLVGATSAANFRIRSDGQQDLHLQRVEIDHGSGWVFWIAWSEIPSPESPVVLAPGEEVAIEVRYLPTMAAPWDPVARTYLRDSAKVEIESDGSGEPLEVLVTGWGSCACCIEPRIAIDEEGPVNIGGQVHLHGGGTQWSSSPVTAYSWSVSGPSGCNLGLEPTNVAMDPIHVPDVAGEYTYCLDACEETHCSSDESCHTTACRTVQAVL